ncbi:Imm50 family immunity protein [Trinickia diaoshuihuensis]|uniref:Imm50 family immunity protein n=1 Tax=Trinickia diaoshuihuensis TaxID=2292265 RepID=UPI000E22AACF
MDLIELPGSELLRRVFTYSPSTEEIDLFDVSLKRDGKTLIAHFDLHDQLPDRPPEKWKNFNRCRLGIYCAAINKLKLYHWNPNNLVRLSIKKIEEHGYEVQFSSNQLEIEFRCQHISVIGPTVYLDE